MSTKPNIAESRFGVDGADADASNMTAPLSGQRDTGWTLNQVPPSAVATYLENKTYRWLKYLSDGALSGDHSVDGALSTTGAVTIGGSLTVGGQSITFVDFTYTADSTTDQLLKTAHGRETGDGPVRTSNSGGALPAGLAAATDYYLIKIDADHVKVATSRANALLGTAINITTNGTGTQTLLHQGGTTRVTDAHVTRSVQVDGGVNVSTLKAVSDDRPVYVDSAGNLKTGHGVQTLVIPGINFCGVIDGSDPADLHNNVVGLVLGRTTGGGVVNSCNIFYGLELIVGARIREVRWNLTDNASGPSIWRLDLDRIPRFGGVNTNIATADSAGSGANQTVSMTFSAEPVLIGFFYQLRLHTLSGTAPGALYSVEVDLDQLTS